MRKKEECTKYKCTSLPSHDAEKCSYRMTLCGKVKKLICWQAGTGHAIDLTLIAGFLTIPRRTSCNRARYSHSLNHIAIHILPVVSQILRLSKPFISCYFVMSSEGLWACCLLLIGYKDGSLLRENLNFLMVNARDYFGLGNLLHLVSISNELYNSGLLASTYLKIIGLKVHYSIGREFFQTTSQTPKLYSCKQKP